MKKRRSNRLIVIAVMLILANYMSFSITIYASDNTDKNSTLNEYIEYEKKVDTGKLNDKIENELNERGMFDSEIELLDQVAIDNLNNAEIIDVQTEYVKIDDQGNAVEMTRQEVDNIIEYRYSDELAESRKENKSVFTSALETIGVIPRTVKADSYNVNYSSSKCFKKSILITQKSVGSTIAHVTVTFTWLTEPDMRHDDFALIYFSDAEILDNSNASCIYYYNESLRYQYSSSNTWEYRYKDIKRQKNYTSNMKENWIIHTGVSSYAYAFIDLENNLTYSDDGVSELLNTDHIIVMQMDIKRDEHDTDKIIIAQAKYYHQQYILDIRPGVAVNTSGSVSFSGGLGASKQMHAMGETLSLKYTWK